MKKREAIAEGYTWAVEPTGTCRKISELSNDDIIETEWMVLDKQSFRFHLTEEDLHGLLVNFVDTQRKYFTLKGDDVFAMLKELDLTKTLTALNAELAKKCKWLWRNATEFILERETEPDLSDGLPESETI